VETVFFPLMLVMFAAVAVAVAIVVGGFYLKKRRREGFALAALQLGLAYAAEDAFGLLDLPFELFTRGDGRGIENVLYGTWEGLPVHVFDYWYYVESSNGKTRSKTYERFNCALGPLDVRTPHLTIAKENILTRVADALALDDLQFESEEFNHAFNVKGDHAFGVAFCDARMMTWLLANGRDFVLEVNDGRMLAACRRVAPTALLPLMHTLRAWRDQVPRVVYSLYPN
jgi:hypothetical protein